MNHVAHTSYNPFLWTMSYEMLGSIMVLLWLYMENEIRHPKAIMVVCIAALLIAGSPLACFFIGLLYGQLRAQGIFARLQEASWAQKASWIGLLGCAAFTPFIERSILSYTLSAAIVLLLIYANRSLSAFLAHNSLSRFLGKISFPLYLVHFSVIASLSSWLIVVADRQGALTSSVAWGIILATVAASILAAILFEPVERLTMALCNRLARMALKRENAPARAEPEVLFDTRAAA